MTTTRWGALAFFTLALAFVLPPGIHLLGHLRTFVGRLAYDLADLLGGPVWAACLVAAILVLRERLDAHAPRGMSVASMAAALAAGAMVAVACIRSANRHYHLAHPELSLESSPIVLTVWTTLVSGLNAVGWHFLGWTFLLVASAAWASRRSPRSLSLLYAVAGVAALFVYLQPALEGFARLMALGLCLWQGSLLWRADEGASREVAGAVPDLAWKWSEEARFEGGAGHDHHR